MRTPLVVAIALMAVIGCDHGRSEAVTIAAPRAAALLAETRSIWVRYGGEWTREVPPAEYPASVRALKPNRVLVDSRGVYIETHSVFVETAGVFVRHDPAYQPPRFGDPGYEPLATDVYWYYAPG